MGTKWSNTATATTEAARWTTLATYGDRYDPEPLGPTQAEMAEAAERDAPPVLRHHVALRALIGQLAEMADSCARTAMDGSDVGHPDAVESHTTWAGLFTAGQMLAALPYIAMPDPGASAQLEWEMELLLAVDEAHTVWQKLLASCAAAGAQRAGLAHTIKSTLRAAADAHEVGHAAAHVLDTVADALVIVWVVERAEWMPCLQAQLLLQAQDAVLGDRGLVRRILLAAVVAARGG